jgi:hypothetical protein
VDVLGLGQVLVTVTLGSNGIEGSAEGEGEGEPDGAGVGLGLGVGLSLGEGEGDGEGDELGVTLPVGAGAGGQDGPFIRVLPCPRLWWCAPCEPDDPGRPKWSRLLPEESAPPLPPWELPTPPVICPMLVIAGPSGLSV